MITILDALENPSIFKSSFSGSSWDTWKAILKAANGLAMSDEDITLFRAVAERDPPKKRVRELWVRAGRRAGKDSIASAIATFAAAFGDYRGSTKIW